MNNGPLFVERRSRCVYINRRPFHMHIELNALSLMEWKMFTWNSWILYYWIYKCIHWFHQVLKLNGMENVYMKFLDSLLLNVFWIYKCIHWFHQVLKFNKHVFPKINTKRKPSKVLLTFYINLFFLSNDIAITKKN